MSSREAQKASATAGGACRTSRAACIASASLAASARPALRGYLIISSISAAALAFPDPVERRLPVVAGERMLLDIAVAANALDRLRAHHGRALAVPELRDRCQQPPEQALFHVVAGIGGTGHAEGQMGGTGPLEHQIGEHGCLDRHSGQRLTEGAAVVGVMQRLRQRGADEPSRADREVQAGPARGRQDGRDAAPLLADEDRVGVVVLDLRRGVGPVTQLVLEALDLDTVRSPVRFFSRRALC